MPEWDADLGWEDAFEWLGSGVPGLSRLGSKVMGTAESDVAAPGWQVNTLYDDPTAQAAQDEIAMQQAIASGRTMDPATRRMQEQFALAGNQAYGAAMAAPLKNAATRGRFARGGQRAISQYAPETLAAQGLMGQEQAQQALMGVLGGRQSLMQQELERSKGAGVGQKMLGEESLAAQRAAASGGISSMGSTLLSVFKDGGVVPGDKDEAVPIIAHGGEVVLSEDVSKKLLKALASKDKGTLQAFERDILKNKGVLQAFERDAPQRGKAKKDENEFTQSYGENVRSAGGYPEYGLSPSQLEAGGVWAGGSVPTYEWTSGWEGPPAPEQIVAPRWAIKDIDQRFEIPGENYPAYADAVIDERKLRYPGLAGFGSHDEGWRAKDVMEREHIAGGDWYRGAPVYPSRYNIPGGQTRTGQSSQMTESQAEEILRKAKLEKMKKKKSGKGRK